MKPKKLRPAELAADQEALRRLMQQVMENLEGGLYTRAYTAEHSRTPGIGVGAVIREGRSGRHVVSALLLVGEAITSDTLRRVPLAAMENAANLSREDVNRDALAALGPLSRDRADSAEDFSRLVAEHYKLWAVCVPNPAAAMAAEHKVKLATMHTWIRDARLRGLLPPARRGKA